MERIALAKSGFWLDRYEKLLLFLINENGKVSVVSSFMAYKELVMRLVLVGQLLVTISRLALN